MKTERLVPLATRQLPVAAFQRSDSGLRKILNRVILELAVQSRLTDAK